jgi:hypothetical protein
MLAVLVANNGAHVHRVCDALWHEHSPTATAANDCKAVSVDSHSIRSAYRFAITLSVKFAQCEALVVLEQRIWGWTCVDLA